MDVWKLIVALVLVVFVVVALYGAASNVWDQGTKKAEGQTKLNNQILGCVQQNQDMSWEKCKEKVEGSNG